MGREIFSNRLEWLMLAQARRVFFHEDSGDVTLNAPNSLSYMYQDVHDLESRGINIEMGSYAGAPQSITGAPVAGGFGLMPLLVLRNLAGVANDWRANTAGPEFVILQNSLRRFEHAMERE